MPYIDTRAGGYLVDSPVLPVLAEPSDASAA